MPKNLTAGIIQIQDLNMGGHSDSKWSGVKNSVWRMIGLNPHATPGIIDVAQALAKISSTTITEFCRERVVSTNGKIYWFSYTSGKIWQQNADTDDTFELVFTTTPAAGAAGCSGAREYRGFIYWATQNRIHRIQATLANGASAWTTNAVEDFATFANGDTEFHPMEEQNLVLYIGDANYIAQIDDGVFSNNALDIKSPLRVKSLGKVFTDLLIGTFVNDYVNKTTIYRWNTWSASFATANEIDEVGVNAFMQGDNIVFVQAGLSGNIYYYDPNTNTLESFKTIAGTYSPTKYGEIHPSSVATLNKVVLFGFSNGSGNPADQGVYAIGRHSRNYPYISDMPYPISERSGGAFVLSGIEIGGIAVRGFNLYVAWKNGSTYGVDKLDYSTKLDKAYIETRYMVSPNRQVLANFGSAVVAYAEMPTNCSVEIELSKNYEAYAPQTVIKDTDRLLVIAEKASLDAVVLQAKFVMRTSGNTAPRIESAAINLR